MGEGRVGGANPSPKRRRATHDAGVNKHLIVPLPLLCAGCGQSHQGPFLIPLAVQVNPSSLSLAQGGDTTVSVTATSGTTSVAPLVVTADAVRGLSVTGTSGGAHIHADADATPGQYALTLHAAGQGGVGDATLQVTVAAAPAPDPTPAADFTVTPDALTLPAGQSAHLAVLITPLHGFSAPTTLSAGATDGLSVKPDTDGQGLTVTAATDLPAGQYALRATVSSGDTSHTKVVLVTVSAAPTNAP